MSVECHCFRLCKIFQQILMLKFLIYLLLWLKLKLYQKCPAHFVELLNSVYLHFLDCAYICKQLVFSEIFSFVYGALYFPFKYFLDNPPYLCFVLFSSHRYLGQKVCGSKDVPSQTFLCSITFCVSYNTDKNYNQNEVDFKISLLPHEYVCIHKNKLVFVFIS